MDPNERTVYDFPIITTPDLLKTATVGTGMGIEHLVHGKTGVMVQGEKFIITGRPASGMRLPPSGKSTSHFFMYRASNIDKMYRLDFDRIKMGPNAGKMGWEHNQEGVHKILNLAVHNHQPAGKLARGAGTTVRVLSRLGRPILVIGMAHSALEVYYAEDRKGAIIKEAGGWAGAAAGTVVGAKAGAAIGGAIGVWFFGAGVVPGAAIGTFIGGAIGGMGGYAAGHGAVSYGYEKLKEEEWILAPSEGQ